MRLRNFVPALLLLLVGPASAVAQAVQSSETPSSTATTTDSLSTTSQQTAFPTLSSQTIFSSASGGNKVTPSTTFRTSQLSIPTQILPLSSAVDNIGPTATPNNAPGGEALPIQPEITPAFGLTGFILLVSGLAYTLVGVRSRWLHIFLSVGYLVALAITVLVLYVANPPVSDAVQGAYFVAALLSGCIIGGLSLIFTEVSEGLGCLLGGFCLAMWFLVLKAGGLVTSSGGRIGLIASFSIVAFAFSFTHHTRTYALMTCIAFAGATIVILGIDCFSRAGLKEFWVYIWDLNDQLFPIDTHTYPLTRGIKVEIVGIVILFLCGLLSQMKLFKILQDRRAKKTLRHAQDEEDREHLEADLGRRIEDTNNRERALWEQKYGEFAEKDHASAAASVAGSIYAPTTASRAQSVKDMTMSVRQLGSPDVDAVEMSEMTRTRKQYLSGSDGKEGKTVVHVQSTGDDCTDQPSWTLQGPNSRQLKRISERPSLDTSPLNSPASTNGFQRMSLRPTAPPPPVIVPLPFTVSEEETRDEDDDESLATVGETAVAEPRAKRASMHPGALAVSHQDLSIDSDAESELVVPHVLEDDQASSLAATLDERTDDEDDGSLPPFSRSASPDRRRVKTKSLRQAVRRVGSATDLRDASSLPDSAVSGVASQRRKSDPPPTALVELVLEGPKSKAPENLEEVLGLKTAPKDRRTSSTPSEKRASDRASRMSSGVLSLAEVKNAKPLSKLALKYRTHEWTKFLDDAETPDLDELAQTEDGVRVERHSRDVPVRVDVQELQRTGSEPLRGRESLNSANPYRNVTRQASGQQQTSSQTAPILPRSVSNPIEVYSHSPQSAQARNSAVQRTFSQPVLATAAQRPTTALIGQPLVESPIEHEQAFPGRSSPISGGTLMGMRDDMIMRRKTSTMSALNYPSQYKDQGSMQNLSLDHPDADNISLSSRKNMLEDDNMPLSRRKTVIKQLAEQQAATPRQYTSTTARSRQSTWPEPAPQTASQPNYSSLIYDSHQPKRGPSVDAYTRQARMASFRESLRQDIGTGAQAAKTGAADEAHRLAMLNEKRFAQAQAQQRQYEKGMLDSVVDQRMRNGEMLSLHRNMLRRMQSQASEHN